MRYCVFYEKYDGGNNITDRFMSDIFDNGSDALSEFNFLIKQYSDLYYPMDNTDYVTICKDIDSLSKDVKYGEHDGGVKFTINGIDDSSTTIIKKHLKEEELIDNCKFIVPYRKDSNSKEEIIYNGNNVEEAISFFESSLNDFKEYENNTDYYLDDRRIGAGLDAENFYYMFKDRNNKLFGCRIERRPLNGQ